MEKKQGKVVVNITKKHRTVLDKNGNILEETVTKDKKEIQEERAKKLGFK